MELSKLELKKLMDVEVVLGAPFTLGDVGQGAMEITPVIGGTFHGTELRGQVLNYGGDWGLAFGEDLNLLNIKYLLQTEDGAVIAVESRGRLVMKVEDMDKAYENGDFSPESCYFREHVLFKTGHEKYKWLNQVLAVAKGAVVEGGIHTEVYVL